VCDWGLVVCLADTLQRRSCGFGLSCSGAGGKSAIFENFLRLACADGGNILGASTAEILT